MRILPVSSNQNFSGKVKLGIDDKSLQYMSECINYLRGEKRDTFIRGLQDYKTTIEQNTPDDVELNILLDRKPAGYSYVTGDKDLFILNVVQKRGKNAKGDDVLMNIERQFISTDRFEQEDDLQEQFTSAKTSIKATLQDFVKRFNREKDRKLKNNGTINILRGMNGQSRFVNPNLKPLN